MIQASNKKDVQKNGVEETTIMELGEGAEITSHIIKVLTENYKYPLESSIREAASNAYDSHIMSGDPDKPFFVRLYKNELNTYNLETEDLGLGMDEKDFDFYYMKVGNSSKRGVAGVLGYYGAGCKAPLSFLNSYEIITRKNGMEYKFLIFKGDDRPEKTKIYEKETNESNGVLVRLVIDRSYLNEAKIAIKKQLSYFKTASISIEGDSFDFNNAKIFENDLFSWSEMYPSKEMHISFGVCHYPIDWDLLKIDKLYLPIAIKINPDEDIKPFFNRESLEYSLICKNIIKKKIEEIAEYFINLYNDSIKEEVDIVAAWNNISNDYKYVNIAENSFCINELEKHSPNVKINELNIKGIELNKPMYYYKRGHNIGGEYECIVDYSSKYNKKWKTKNVHNNMNLCDFEKKCILVEKTPVGNLKKYLLEKYSGRLMFIKKVNNIILGAYKERFKRITYRYILDLNDYPKSEWRERIKEWQFVENEFKKLIDDETNCENSEGYKNWLEEQRKIAKTKIAEKSTYISNYVKINKKEGDIVLQLAVRKEKGDGCKFVKKAVKITNLNKLSKNTRALHIYFKEEDKKRASDFYDLFGYKYSICLLSTRELNILNKNKNKQFMLEEEFLQSRPFCKIMTSLKFEKVLNTYDTIYRKTGDEIIKSVLNNFYDDKVILRNYVQNNGRDINNELLNELKEIAQLKNLYDRSLDDVYNRFKNNVDKYEFISCLNTPRSWEEEEVIKYKKLINSLLLLKSKHNNYEEFEIELKPKVVEELVSI